MLARSARVAPGQRVLDAGAGDGGLTLTLARRGAEVVAADLSPAMVDRGRDRTASAGCTAQWREADVEELPFADGAFDAVLSSFGALWAPEPGRAVAEMTRVCRPGGTLGMTAWTPAGFMGRVIALAREATVRPAGVPPPERWGRYETAYLHLFGLEELEVLDETLGLPFADRDELWSVMSAAPGPLAAAVRAVPERAPWLRTRLEELAERHGEVADGGLEIRGAYAVMVGRRPQW